MFFSICGQFVVSIGSREPQTFWDTLKSHNAKASCRK
jgi:hypothetical protein